MKLAYVFSLTNGLESDLCKKIAATFQKKYSESKVATGNRYKYKTNQTNKQKSLPIHILQPLND